MRFLRRKPKMVRLIFSDECLYDECEDYPLPEGQEWCSHSRLAPADSPEALAAEWLESA